MPKKDAIEIIYQDADILVINKPTGLSVTKDRVLVGIHCRLV